jgi:hypothetical protein
MLKHAPITSEFDKASSNTNAFACATLAPAVGVAKGGAIVSSHWHFIAIQTFEGPF